ncbi:MULTISPECIES: ATP-binding protein [Staphylococcus]|jgi:hypothetical protein|nr:ATP-binding protein [Staphylococcus epidermidis]HDG3442467.1 ATP-binding protein [Staphylococcus aureus]KAB1898190.1 ATP-binding protein [Staphylococcus epidermidis ATCC 12228]MCG2371916.1 ATP-binding protein [Staphylococcus epidermidis]MCK6108330.1 ATP-binding protein [Staphylococcus epidermidis]OOD02739.1 AAA family ATPase [Staphylococcus epidermidis]
MITENKIKEILKTLPNENSKLDYKLKEYATEKKGDLIKDILAMLNSLEAYNENKFIVFGINDNKEIIGLEKNMFDDAHYQNIIDEYINPRPKIETGQIEYNDEKIGYIAINSNNLETPYELKKELRIKKSKSSLSKGLSFIRKGSTNTPIIQEEREKLILKKTEKNPNNKNLFTALNQKNHAIEEIYYKDNKKSGRKKLDPSNNNGRFTIGELSYEFEMILDVASNEIARIMKTDTIKVARIKNYKDNDIYYELQENLKSPNEVVKKLDTSSRSRDFTLKDLGILINKHGRIAEIFFKEIKSESHGSEENIVEIEWNIPDTK